MIMEPPPPRFDRRVLDAVVSLPAGPPPISGGTLAMLPDGHRVVVSDPDRDRVLVVDVDASEAPRVESLPAGSEPGRIAIDGAGRAHVVLRGRGELLSFDAASPGDHGTRRSVCPMPRGVAFDAEGDTLHVACQGGELVTLPAAGGAATRTQRLDRDLRDVVVIGDRLHVTRFRSAEVLVLDREGALVERRRPAALEAAAGFSNAVAWRALPTPDGKLALLHQREADTEVRPSVGGYGPEAFFSCSGIVRSAFSIVGGSGDRPGVEIAGATLPVDFAIEAAGGAIARIAVIAAGNQSGEHGVFVMDAAAMAASCSGGLDLHGPDGAPITNPIAVVFASRSRVVVQQRDPAQLVVVGVDGAGARAIALGGAPAFDTGHAIFHASTGSGVACASCHPEGREDGHVWRFSDLGERRTPALHAVAGTAPFHWSGDLESIRHLMNEVFVMRMRGHGVDGDHADAVEAWLRHVPAPRASTAASAEPVARGRALFEGAAECASCHAGALYSNGQSADVGTGGTFQVPSLIGLADRLPVMRTGCATTLAARFEPSCGGDRHGPALTAEQRADLIAFLESL